ncbi:uncharacterized protein [Physcomitrium patens]|uniref:uncharacterized protein isoform X1 n=1 Tax=Physcomitrium patens TaxID=3218 RepID=UPI003CCD6AFF
MAKEGGVSLGLRVSVKRFCEIYPGGVSHYGVYREESTLWFSYCTTFKSMKAMLGEGLRTTHDDFIPSSILLLAPRIKIPRWNTVWKADFITIVKGTEYVRFFEHTVFFVLLFAIAPSSSVLFQSLQFPNTD